MKKQIIILLLIFPFIVNAQVKRPQNLPGYDDKTLHWGFTVGAATWDYHIDRTPGSTIIPDIEDPSLNFGLQVTIVSDLRLNEFMTLRFLPGLALGQTDISFYGRTDQIIDKAQKFELAALQFPLILKVRSLRLNNTRPYLLGGLNYIYDMTGAKRGEGEILFETLRGDLCLELGYGIDLYLQYFKFSPEIKLGIGLVDLLNRDPAAGQFEYVSSIDKIKSFYVMFNFHFE